MIDLTPLDVRNKRGDFKKLLRGYDPQEVDSFLELAAERLEALVRENMQLRERSEALQQQVTSQTGRERAVQEALVTAQELRTEMRSHAQRQADLLVSEAQAEARRQLAEAESQVRGKLRDAEQRLEQVRDALEELERRRVRFLRSFRQLLERELDEVEVEERRQPLEQRSLEVEAGAAQPLPADLPVDALAAEFREEAAELFGAGRSGDPANPPPGERDLFSRAGEAAPDEPDARRG